MLPAASPPQRLVGGAESSDLFIRWSFWGPAPSGSCLEAPPYVPSLAQTHQGLFGSGTDTPVDQEVLRVGGALCQAPGTKTKSVSHFTANQISPCHAPAQNSFFFPTLVTCASSQARDRTHAIASNPSCCGDNAGHSTHWAPRELHHLHFFKKDHLLENLATCVPFRHS